MNRLYAAISLLWALTGLGQPYSLDWHKIAGGGSTSTNGQYSVSGTVGQQDASRPSSGGNYSLTGGYWSLISLAHTPDAPPLQIRQSGDSVIIFWRDVAGWELQQNTNLTAEVWSPSAHSITSSSGTNQIVIALPAGNLFFRLHRP